MMLLVPLNSQLYMAQKVNRTWSITLTIVIKESCCCNCSALSTAGGRNPGTSGLRCFSLWNYSVFIPFGLNPNCVEVSGKNPEGFAELGIRHFVHFIEFSCK